MAIGNIEHLKNDLQESQLGPDLPPHREEGRWISGLGQAHQLLLQFVQYILD